MIKYLKRITPFILASSTAIVAAFSFLLTGGDTFKYRIGFFIPLVLLSIVPLILDFLLKRYLQSRGLVWIWVTELILLLGAVYYWIVK
ncbi:hypothetical protein QTN47_10055 [Danxiaibacter flavus]|uniref:Uncharacterized protein n=1 Tax=Danxiaibacter flavus TaxID=3049108 RepID=A0ABV3ZDB6_9BACT|nr:hypothetical protein QNM32_10055 [Chitinophagaceae bacterium DXS]